MESRLDILNAVLVGIEQRELVDAIISRSLSDDQIIDELAAPPLRFTRVEAEAVINMTLRARSQENVARIRAERDAEQESNQGQ